MSAKTEPQHLDRHPNRRLPGSRKKGTMDKMISPKAGASPAMPSAAFRSKSARAKRSQSAQHRGDLCRQNTEALSMFLRPVRARGLRCCVRHACVALGVAFALEKQAGQFGAFHAVRGVVNEIRRRRIASRARQRRRNWRFLNRDGLHRLNPASLRDYQRLDYLDRLRPQVCQGPAGSKREARHE